MNDKQKIVLHICCAPDEAWVVHTLQETHDVHCFFCNPNISPAQEYILRCEEAAKVARYYNVPFTADDYKPETWEDAVAGVTDTPEGGERCRRCFEIRLTRTALFCKSTGLADFTTVMSVSPHKNNTVLNDVGTTAAAKYGLTYHCFDFKKNDGFRKSIVLSKELGLYRQDYCGCRLSKMESEERKKLREMRKVQS